jgi:GT2 family glycosyltransferase
MRPPPVAIIILNWNGINDTLECLESVRQIQYDNFSIVVVDNGSEDDSCLQIRNNYPEVKLIENRANLGFAEGNNVGIRYALDQGADFVFLLNNDTVVDPLIVTELLAAARINDDDGIYGAKIYYYSEPEKIWYAGAWWDNDNCQFSHSNADITEVVVTDYVCGCTMFISRKTLEIIGLMDPVFFLTYEETDWCYRALRSGVKSYCVPTAKVWHKISASFGGNSSPIVSYFMSRNLLLWAERNLSLINYCRVTFRSLQNMVWLSQPDVRPPFFRIRIFALLIVVLKHMVGKYPSTVSHASYLGIRDYFFRQFGNCSREATKLL